ncbi:hypothetical protein [Arthrobacter sp. UYEF36]|uniref:hypothetical protein n=1 Tax=Arthrobacter sp. UYEF36 TaxID=1756366 RepID=UPI0033950090
MIMLTTGFAISVTAFLLRTSRFASIENCAEALGPLLYDELAPALPAEQVLLVTGVIIALAGLLGLIADAIRGRRKGAGNGAI